MNYIKRSKLMFEEVIEANLLEDYEDELEELGMLDE